MFHLATALLGIFVTIRFVWPLPWPKTTRVAVSCAIMVVSQHHLASRIVFGTMFSPEVPRWSLIAVNWLFGAILLLVGLQLVLDILTVLRSLLSRRKSSVPAWARYMIGLLALSVSAVGVNQAVRVPPVKTVEIAIKGLPLEFDGYRIVQLADLHISRLFQAPWVEAVVERTNAAKPDLIVIAGDVIDGYVDARGQDVEPLGHLRAPDGVYVIPGNHEYYFGYPEWMKRFKELGMQTLQNSHAVLQRGQTGVVLAGVTDLAAVGRDFPGPDPGEAIRGAPSGMPVILLDHQPKQALLNARAGASLQLSGHTHGGMILGFDRFIALFNNGYVSGKYDVQGMPLYVTNGTALWNGFALRLGKPSELTVIVLRRA